MVHAAKTTFDPERARRSIDAAIEGQRRYRRMLPLLMVLLPGAILFSNLFEREMAWFDAVAQPAIFIILSWVVWKTVETRVQSLAAEAASGLDGLESAYRKRANEVDRWSQYHPFFRGAVCMAALAGLASCLLRESSSTFTRWAWGLVFVGMLLYGLSAFSRGQTERSRAKMLGLSDTTSAEREPQRDE